MPRRSSGKPLSPASLPLTPLRIGLWDEDVAADCVRGDAMMAEIFGLPETEATEGISRAHLLSIFHPEDVVRDPELRRSVREEGGLFVWEHRILPAPGIVRWVLARGHYERSPGGGMVGRGIVIDVTDIRIDGEFDGPARFLAACEASGALLERMAELALELSDMVRQFDPGEAARLRSPIEALLYEIGRQIAASLRDEPSAREPTGSRKIH